jgi:DNA mismatch repair protein MutS
MMLPHLQLPEHLVRPKHVEMDPSTVANLELFSSLRTGMERPHQITTLIQLIDKSKTAMGGRLLRSWLRQPLAEKTEIERRLDIVEHFLRHPTFLSQLQTLLREFIDLERLLSRIVLKQGSPKDLRSLVEMVSAAQKVQRLLEKQESPLFASAVASFSDSLFALRQRLDATLLDDPAFDPRQGGVIREGVHARLDELNRIVQSSHKWIAELEVSERQKTSISTLKIRYNQVFGFYIEVSKANLSLVPEYFLRKQTLVNAERFITPDLKKHEEIILGAKSETDKIEYEIFLQLVDDVKTQIADVQQAAQAIAEVDCLAGFAECAKLHNYTRPQLNTSGELKIVDGRHPVVEEILQQRFVANSVHLDPGKQQLLLLTGPNMAGKSVLMRQVALITIMAHVGCYVPAKEANISLTDRVFVRSGAADMITAGLSTFMVEMVETAQILHNATEHSLVIMDEIGRGTSTYDGISIAWAVAEELVKKTRGPKTLFATHYHELQELAERFPQKIRNAHMAVTQRDQQPVFLYSLQDGGASHSFGLAVAKLAGISEPVTARAAELLHQLEHGDHTLASPLPVPENDTLMTHELSEINPESLTPLEALTLITKWKDQSTAS